MARGGSAGLIMATVLFVVVGMPLCVWGVWVYSRHQELSALLAQAPAAERSGEIFVSSPDDDAQGAAARRVLALASALPDDGPLRKWPLFEPRAAWEKERAAARKLAQDFTQQAASARRELAHRPELRGVVCVEPSFPTDAPTASASGLRSLTSVLLLEHEAALRAGERQEALERLLEVEPMTRLLDGVPCMAAYRDDLALHAKLLHQIGRQLDGIAPDAETSRTLRGLLEAPDNLDDATFARAVRHARMQVDDRRRRAHEPPGWAEQSRIRPLRLYARALDALELPPTQRLDALFGLITWSQQRDPDGDAHLKVEAESVAWSYEVLFMIRALRTLTVCMLDMAERYGQDGIWPPTHPEGCDTDGRGQPLAWQQDDHRVEVRLAADWDWPDRIEVSYTRPDQPGSD